MGESDGHVATLRCKIGYTRSEEPAILTGYRRLVRRALACRLRVLQTRPGPGQRQCFSRLDRVESVASKVNSRTS